MGDRKSYEELIRIHSFEERFEYLRIGGGVGNETFGFDRHLNQRFYRSREWRITRRNVIVRDMGLDLAHSDYPIRDKILIHHLNPISKDDLIHGSDSALDMDNLVAVSHITHNAIHYGSADLLPKPLVERRPGDTKLW